MARCSKCNEILPVGILGVCWECADTEEAKLARRTVIEHLRSALTLRRKPRYERYIDLAWAWERLTKSGDYAPNGRFDRKYGII